MMKDGRRSSEWRYVRLIAFGVVLNAVLSKPDELSRGLSWLLGLIAPILLGLTVALILYVPMHGFERLFTKLDRRNRMPEKPRTLLSLLLAVIFVPIFLFILIHFIVPQFISAVTNVIAIVQTNRDQIAEFVSRIGLDPLYVEQKLAEMGEWISANIGRIAGTTLTTAVNIFTSVTDVLLAVILAVYLLADKRALSRRAKRTARALLPERASAFACRFASVFVSTFRTFLSRQCLEAMILGGLILACMLIFRIPYAVTICSMTALMALIPYIGAFISMFIGCVLVVTISPMKALIFAIIFLVAQQVEGNIIYPRVVGKSVGLPAYVTLAAVMIGGALAGVAGMFFIIPVVSVFYVLMREFVQKKNAEKDALGEQP